MMLIPAVRDYGMYNGQSERTPRKLVLVIEMI